MGKTKQRNKKLSYSWVEVALAYTPHEMMKKIIKSGLLSNKYGTQDPKYWFEMYVKEDMRRKPNKQISCYFASATKAAKWLLILCSLKIFDWNRSILQLYAINHA